MEGGGKGREGTPGGDGGADFPRASAARRSWRESPARDSREFRRERGAELALEGRDAAMTIGTRGAAACVGPTRRGAPQRARALWSPGPSTVSSPRESFSRDPARRSTRVRRCASTRPAGPAARRSTASSSVVAAVASRASRTRCFRRLGRVRGGRGAGARGCPGRRASAYDGGHVRERDLARVGRGSGALRATTAEASSARPQRRRQEPLATRLDGASSRSWLAGSARASTSGATRWSASSPASASRRGRDRSARASE
jgi:hypothetical protein